MTRRSQLDIIWHQRVSSQQQEQVVRECKRHQAETGVPVDRSVMVRILIDEALEHRQMRRMTANGVRKETQRG